MQFTYMPDVGPLPLRFGMTKDHIDSLFKTFDVPSAYYGKGIAPQNAIGAYSEYDTLGQLWCVEFSPRCSLLYGENSEEVFDDEDDNLLYHFAELLGGSLRIKQGFLYTSVNAFATISADKVVSLLVFTAEYRRNRFGT